MLTSNPVKRAALMHELEGGNLFVDANLFLDGNEDLGSLGCNLHKHPGMNAFRSVVRAVAGRHDVSGVLVEIKDIMEDPEWPFTDTILVCSTAPKADVADWFACLSPDDVFEIEVGPTPAYGNFRRWAVWWD